MTTLPASVLLSWACVLLPWTARNVVPCLGIEVALQEAWAGGRVTLAFDRATNEFALSNGGRFTVWYLAYGRMRPLCWVFRLTPEGRVMTWSDWCGTGARRWPLRPAQVLRFSRKLGRSSLSPTVEMVEPRVKHPEFWTYPAQLSVTVFRKYQGGRAEPIQTEKIDPPPK